MSLAYPTAPTSPAGLEAAGGGSAAPASPFVILDPADAVAVSPGIYTHGGITAAGGVITVTDLSDSGMPTLVSEMYHMWFLHREMTWAEVLAGVAWLRDVAIAASADMCVGLTWATGPDPDAVGYYGRTALWSPGNGLATDTSFGVFAFANNAGVNLVGSSTYANTTGGHAFLLTDGASRMVRLNVGCTPNGAAGIAATAGTTVPGTDPVYVALTLCRRTVTGAAASGSFSLGVAT